MKNIEKKWLLFLMSTFVTFFGIGYTLLKDTFALNEIDNTIQESGQNYDSSDVYDITLSNNCELGNIIFNNGKIDFKKNVFEYNLFVEDIKNLEMDYMLVPSASDCSIHNDFVEEENMFVVTVYASNEVVSVYKINVFENVIDDNGVNKKEKTKDYTYVFIVIIGVLVLINIYRIVKKMRSK